MPPSYRAIADPDISDRLQLHLSGGWCSANGLPGAADLDQDLKVHPDIRSILIDGGKLTAWDSGLLAFLINFECLSADRQITANHAGPPEGVQRLLRLAFAVPERAGARRQAASVPFLERIGTETRALMQASREVLGFLGEATLAFGRLLRGRTRIRRSDFLLVIQELGAQALPIVALISFLVSVILAFLGTVQLLQFGAQIYAAGMVAIGMVRDMAPGCLPGRGRRTIKADCESGRELGRRGFAGSVLSTVQCETRSRARSLSIGAENMSRHKGPKADNSQEAAGYVNDARRCRDMAEEYQQETFLGQAGDFERAADAYLTVADPPTTGTGGEFTIDKPEEPGLQPRLNRPSRVNINASDDRISLLIDTETVDMGLDLAESIQARDSVERMIAHQMALAHRLAMRFGRRTEQELWRQTNPNAASEASRAANSVARLMKAFQEGAQTLAKLRNGGRQIVTVQHVTVEPGGQAVVAGNVDRKNRGG